MNDTAPTKLAEIEQRFWSKVDKSGDCWLWTAYRTKDGYGLFRFGGKMVGAHRVAYILSVGPIPEGKQLDHLCRTSSCVRAPDHLEPVTSRENILRGKTLAAANRLKTHCPHGHPYDEANTVIKQGGRFCRICLKAIARATYERHRTRINAERRQKKAAARIGKVPQWRLGEDNRQARLTAGRVKAMRRRYAQGGVTYDDLAREYGVSFGSVGRVIRGELWVHVS